MINLSIERYLKCIVLAALLLITPEVASTDTMYRYTLKQSRSNDICYHMLQTFNRDFKFLWSAPPRWDQLLHSDPDWAQTFTSWYPSSPEFDAIVWRRGSYPFNGSRRLFLVAHIDIANDGVTRDVMKDLFVLGPNAVRNLELLKVFPSGTFQDDALELDYDVWNLHSPLMSLIGGDLLVRVFSLKGKVYLASYTDNREIDALAVPPEFMYVRRYLGEGTVDTNTELICTFSMKQL